MKPLDLREWADSMVRSGIHVDYAREVLDMLHERERLGFLEEVAETVRLHAKSPTNEEGREDRAAEWLNDRHNLLAEIEDVLGQNGYPGDADDALTTLLADLEDKETELESYRIKNKEYDL